MKGRIEVHLSGPDEQDRYWYTLYRKATTTPGDPAGEHMAAERRRCFAAATPEWCIPDIRLGYEILNRNMAGRREYVLAAKRARWGRLWRLRLTRWGLPWEVACAVVGAAKEQAQQ